jgi:antirestriction protein
LSEREHQEREQASNERDRRISPKIWIASLSDYNAGHLHGGWIEADGDAEDIWAGVNEVLRTSNMPGAEEWAIFDYEGFGPARLSEYESVERVSRLGRGIDEHGEAFAAFANFLGQDEDELLDRFEESYLGRWESLTAYAEDYMESFGINDLLDKHVPEALRDYVRVDAETLGCDWEYEGVVLAIEGTGGVFLFHPP